MKISIGKLSAFLVLLITFNSGIISQLLKASSLYPSVLISSYVLFFNILIRLEEFRLKKSYIIFVLLLITYLFISFDVSLINFGENGVEKSLKSFLLFSFILFSIPVIPQIINEINISYVHKIMKIFVLIFAITGLISYYFQKSGFFVGKYMILYTEPSHFAIALIPILLFIVKSTKNEILKITYVMTFSMLALLLESLTLLVGTIFISLVGFWRYCVKFIIVFIFFLILTHDDLQYFTYRIKLDTESSVRSLSSLVYLSGWERAYMSLTESYFLGIGFNRLGYVGYEGEFMKEIRTLLFGEELNLYDGGTQGAKIISEFGVLGIILVILYIIGFLKIFFMLVKIKNISKIDILKTFYSSYYLSYIIELFVRGVGFFSPNFVLFIASVYYLFFYTNKRDIREN